MKRQRWYHPLLAVLFTTTACAISANATTYYVSSSGGNDGNNGTSTSTPWQTTAKVNNFALNPGDSVLFKRGDNWYSQLAPTRSGSQGNSITFADYGTGNKPTFWGSDPLPKSGWTSAGTNEWSVAYNASSPTGVIVDGYQGVAGAWMVPGNPASQGFFQSGGGTVTINWPTNPNTDSDTFTIDSREDVIYSNAQSHLVFNNLLAREATDPGLGYVIRVQNSADVIFNSCEADCGSKHLWGFINATGVIANNCNAQWGLPFNGANGCTFYVSYADQSGPYSGCTSVYNNCAGSGFTDGQGGSYQYFVCHGPNQGPITFNNPQDNGGLFSVLEDSGVVQPVQILGGVITNNDLELTSHDTITRGVLFLGNASVDNWGANNLFENCVFQSIVQPSGGLTGYWTAILNRAGATNATYRFCTVVMDPSTYNGTTAVANTVTGLGTKSYGNIFVSHTGKVVNVWACGATTPPTSADYSGDYNDYQASPTPIFDFDNISFATWKTDTGADAHTKVADPLFTNQAGFNYNLTSSSPAIDSMLYSPISPAAPSTDFAGNPRLKGSAYDMGAYEYQGPPQPPTITSATSATAIVTFPFSYQITATNNPTSFGASPLPAGLSVNTGTGLISGTPTATGTTNVTISATNAVGPGTATLVLTVNPVPPAPVVSSAASASGTQGLSFSYQITASNSPTSFGATPLPAGLTVSSSTGLISGTPTAPGTTNTTVSATNVGGTGTKVVAITITGAAPVITSAASAGGRVGAAFSYQITATNGPTSYGASSLPAGVTVNTATGLISGTPSTSATYNVGLSATNSTGTGTKTLVLTISPQPTIAGSVATSPASVNLTSEGTDDWAQWGLSGTAENQKSVSGSPVNHISALTGAGQGFQSWTGFGTSMSWSDGTPTASATTTNCVENQGQGNGFTFTVPADTTLKTVKIYVACPNGANGQMIASLSDGSASTYNDTSVTNGNVVYTINYSSQTSGQTLNVSWKMNTGSGQVLISAVTLASATGGPPPAPSITSALTKSGTVGTALTYNITATNSPTSYNATPLPAGLSVNTATGAITGTPTTTGTTNTTISATNAGGTGSATLVFTINAAIPAITSSLTQSGTVGTALTYNITATNSPTSYGATPLPAGLSVNTATGAITGTPTTAGTTNTTISATNASGTGSATLVFTIGSTGTAFNIYAIFTEGTVPTHGGADNGTQGYDSNLLGTTATFNGSTFTFGAANAANAWNNTTVNLPAGTYTTLNMIGTAVQGNVTAQTFTVHYTDGTTSVFTQNLHDWKSSGSYTGETKVSTQASQITTTGAPGAPATYIHGYTFTLNGKSVQSITLPATRQVLAFGFAGR